MQRLRKVWLEFLLKIIGAKRVPIINLWNNDTSETIEEYVDGKLKFIESNTTKSLILTPTGFKPIKTLYKTVPYDVYRLRCENGNVLECADTHLVYNKDKEQFVFVKDLYRGENIECLHDISQVTFVHKTKQCENMYDLEIDDPEEHRYYSNDILSHNTTTVGAYLLWFAAFSDEPVTILVVSNKSDNAKEIIERIKTMYEGMPLWLKPGVTDDGYNKHSIKFDNGSRIISQATSENSGRGLSISLLFCHDGQNEVDVMDEDGNVQRLSLEQLGIKLNGQE